MGKINQKSYKDIFSEQQEENHDEILTFKDYLDKCSHDDKDSIEFWNKMIIKDVFLKWDKKNKEKVNRIKEDPSQKDYWKVVDDLICLEENVAGFVPYLYHPTNDRGMGFIADTFYKLVERYNDKIKETADQINNQFQMNFTATDVTKYFKTTIRKRHSDWVNHVNWAKPMNWIFDIDFDVVCQEIVGLCSLFYYYKNNKKKDQNQVLRYVTFKLLDIYKKQIPSKWDAYSVFLSRTHYIEDSDVFDWIAERYFKDKINYFVNYYPLQDFFENIDKLINLSLKDLIAYLDTILGVYKNIRFKESADTAYEDGEINDNYYEFLQNESPIPFDR